MSDQWSPTSVQVTVLQASGLRVKGKSGTNDAYAVMQVGKEKFQTAVVEKTVAPVWKEEATFDLPPVLQGGGGGPERCKLQVQVLHRALVGPDKLLGQAVINLLQLSEDKTRNKTEWFKLLDKTGKSDKERGEVLLDVQFLRNNLTASMFDLSAAGKSRSRLGKFKDKVRGKKKDSDSPVVPSLTQVLTDSEEEEGGNEDAEGKEGKSGKSKKHKMKSLFAPKSNLQKSMSQSMSVLPAKNSSLSGSQSSGLNAESSEGKKKFKFSIHKRSGSSDNKDSSSGRQKQNPAEQSNLCINGSHVYCEEPPPQTSRLGSNFSLTSSGHESMEDASENSPSVDSLKAVREYSPWMEEEEDEERDQDVTETEEEDSLQIKEGSKEETLRRQQEELRQEEDERIKFKKEEERNREEKEMLRKQELEKLRQKEEAEEERAKREEEERIQQEKLTREEEEGRKAEEEQAKREEEERILKEMKQKEEERRKEEEEQNRLAEEQQRLEEERIQKEMEMKQEEEERRKKEEQKRLAEEQQRLDEEERRKLEERIRREEEKALERKRQEEEYKLAEEKRLKEEERLRREEERRREDELMKKQEQRRQKEEEERLEKEEMKRLEEEERVREEHERLIEEMRRKAEEKIRLEEEEKVRMEEEKRQKEQEERRKKEEVEMRKREELERLRREDEKKRGIEEERAKREEEERIQKEEDMRREEEDRIRKEEEERLKREEEKRRKEEVEKARKEKEDIERRAEEVRRMKEEEKRRMEEEERIRREERAEKERKEEEERKLEEENKRNEEQRATEKTSKIIKAAEITSTNPFDEDFSFPEEIPKSSPDLHNLTENDEPLQQRCQPAVSSARSDAISADEKDLINTQREKRPAPQPPGKNLPERWRQSEEEEEECTRHLSQINKQSKEKDVKTVSVPPQRSVQVIAPLNRSPKDSKNTQSEAQNSSTKPGKRPAPSRPPVEDEPPSESTLSVGKTSHRGVTETQQVRTVHSLNPFDDDDEDELADQDDTTVCWLPAASQTDVDVSQAKLKSSKVVRAPPPPALNEAPSGILIHQNNVTDETCDPLPEVKRPNKDSEKNKVVAGVKEEGPPVNPRRLQTVKPLNPLEQQQPASVVQQENNKSTGSDYSGDQHNTKVDAVITGPYSQLTHEELISLVLKQEKQLAGKDKKISELERYIDNLLVRVIEEQPSILMSLSTLK